MKEQKKEKAWDVVAVAIVLALFSAMIVATVAMLYQLNTVVK